MPTESRFAVLRCLSVLGLAWTDDLFGGDIGVFGRGGHVDLADVVVDGRDELNTSDLGDDPENLGAVPNAVDE